MGITVLRTAGLPATKTIGLVDGRPAIVASYSDARWFAVRTMAVGDLPSLVNALESVDANEFVIRGEPLQGTDLSHCRRLLYADHETGDPATFYEVPRPWVLFDVDDLPAPEGIDAVHGVLAALHAREQLPAAFHDAAHWFQLTASAGIKPGIRIRLAFWLDRALTGAELDPWLAAAPVDRSVFRPVQPITVVPPILLPGVRDPARYGRSGVNAGEGEVEVPPIPAAPEVVLDAPPPGARWVSGQSAMIAEKRLAGLVRTVSTASVGERHQTLFWAVRTAIELDDAIPRGEIADRLMAGARAAGLRDADLARQVRNAIKSVVMGGAVP